MSWLSMTKICTQVIIHTRIVGATHRLTTKTALLAVITTLSLSVERVLTLLVLSDLPFLVVSAILVLAVSLQFLGKVNHFCGYTKMMVRP